MDSAHRRGPLRWQAGAFRRADADRVHSQSAGCQQIENVHITLVDCDDASRVARLHLDRSQPGLANPTMMNWARYLRNETRECGAEILDTSELSIEECINHVKRVFGSSRSTKP
jgi:hypothetical protein